MLTVLSDISPSNRATSAIARVLTSHSGSPAVAEAVFRLFWMLSRADDADGPLSTFLPDVLASLDRMGTANAALAEYAVATTTNVLVNMGSSVTPDRVSALVVVFNKVLAAHMRTVRVLVRDSLSVYATLAQVSAANSVALLPGLDTAVSAMSAWGAAADGEVASAGCELLWQLSTHSSFDSVNAALVQPRVLEAVVAAVNLHSAAGAGEDALEDVVHYACLFLAELAEHGENVPVLVTRGAVAAVLAGLDRFVDSSLVATSAVDLLVKLSSSASVSGSPLGPRAVASVFAVMAAQPDADVLLANCLSTARGLAKEPVCGAAVMPHLGAVGVVLDAHGVNPAVARAALELLAAVVVGGAEARAVVATAFPAAGRVMSALAAEPADAVERDALEAAAAFVKRLHDALSADGASGEAAAVAPVQEAVVKALAAVEAL